MASGEAIWARHFEAAEAGAEALATHVGQHVVIAMRRRGPLEASLRAAQPGHTPDAADLALMGWGDLDTRKSLTDVHRARERFERALRDDPHSAIALTLGMWGQMQIMRGRPDLALPAFDKANRMVPSQPAPYVQAATARLLLGRADEVQALADRAVELGAGDARRVSPAYLIAAEAALLLGEDERAHELARRAVAELPSNARAHATLAAIDALAGRDEQAKLEMAAFLKLWPTATVARYDELRPSNHPVYLAQRERLDDGLRKAGLPER